MVLAAASTYPTDIPRKLAASTSIDPTTSHCTSVDILAIRAAALARAAFSRSTTPAASCFSPASTHSTFAEGALVTVTLASDLLAELVGHYAWRHSAVVKEVVKEDVVRLVCHQADRYATAPVVSSAAHLIDEVASFLMEEQRRNDKEHLTPEEILEDEHRQQIWPLLVNVDTLNHKPRTLGLAMSGLHALATMARHKDDPQLRHLHATAVRFAYSAMQLHPANDWIRVHASRLLRETVTHEELALELRVLQDGFAKWDESGSHWRRKQKSKARLKSKPRSSIILELQRERRQEMIVNHQTEALKEELQQERRQETKRRQIVLQEKVAQATKSVVFEQDDNETNQAVALAKIQAQAIKEEVISQALADLDQAMAMSMDDDAEIGTALI